MTAAVITLAGGCFWGVEHLFRTLPGVVDTVCGYANGRGAAFANYEAVCSGITGFREVVQITYDPTVVPLEQLLFAFFAVVDVTVFSRQGFDIGPQYQTGVYWSSPQDRPAIESVFAIERAAASEFYVELCELRCFFSAEEYHQRYLQRNPEGYCHIAPSKMAAIRAFPFRKEAYTVPACVLLSGKT